MPAVVMYSTPYCTFCLRAKRLLDEKKVKYVDHRVDINPRLRETMIKKSGRFTVPQIWIDDHHIGGFEELLSLDQRGMLDKLLNLAEPEAV